MYRLHISDYVIEVEEISRKGFDHIVAQMAEAAVPLDRFPTPPADHRCVQCPIDPHTMRRVIRLLADMRNARLERFKEKADREPVNALVEILGINTLDTAIGYLCGGLAPELAVSMRENFSE
jgi:hypothetical protein